MRYYRSPLWSRVTLGVIQAAMFMAVLWLAYGTEEGRHQHFGAAPATLGMLLAFLVTYVPMVLKDIVVGLYRTWRGDFR